MADKVIGAALSGTSPEALLKQAVTDGKEKAALTAVAPSLKPARRTDIRVAGAALALGVLLGAGTATLLAASHNDHASDSLSQIQAHLDTGQADAARLRSEIDRIGKILAQLQETYDTARADSKTRAASLGDRIARSEQSIGTKLAAMSDRQDQAERDHNAKLVALSALLEKRFATPAPVVTAPQAARSVPPEPSETGSLPDAKPKPLMIDTWAVREVYDGIAILEDRKRRLVEIGPGGSIPGIGRVDAIERRGRSWVVVTKQGLITSQAW